MFKEKILSIGDVRISNTHLIILNEIVGHNLFRKNDAYITSNTLWELMQPIGDAGSHNYHGLSPEDIYYALNKLINPIYIIKVKNERIGIVPFYISTFDVPLMVVIEIGARLKDNPFANINKIVTIYPKSDLDEYVTKLDQQDVLYIKK